jgi:biotin carboxyl carrier protein
VGQLKQATNQLDLEFAYGTIKAAYLKKAGDSAAAWSDALDAKQLLLTRPIQRLFNEPHYMSGWLSVNKEAVSIDNGNVVFKRNPIELLSELYHFLNMDFTTGKAARHMIWDHDQDILKAALSFYASLKDILSITEFPALEKAIAGKAPSGIEADQWSAIQASHAGFQAGTELFAVLPYVGNATYFSGLEVNPDLSITIPEELKDKTLQDAMTKVLVPPPTAKSDEILALSGGMYYPREAPGLETYVNEGDHFEAGDVLYIVEVMKMFNKVHATFAGTVDKVLVENDGEIIKKGQPIFKVTPDEKIVIETADEVSARKQAKTAEFLAVIGH